MSEERTTSLIGGDGCLAIEALVAMAEGRLASARREPVLAHVDRCPRCAEVIANLGALDASRRRVGRYVVERVLGVGGMGIVYAAFDPQLERRVAVKLVRPENTHAAAQDMIIAEARTLARISHPNVVAVYDAGDHAGEVYIATELVDGVTLAQWQRGRSTTKIVRAWIQISRGLAAAHREGVVHRDVKPANALVGRDGRVRIGDFGIAHHGGPPPVEEKLFELASGSPDSTAGTSGTVAGTPAYMAPEHRAGRAEPRSDQFSASVAIVEALTGNRPHANDDVVLEPRALAAVLTRGLRFAVEERWPTMNDFAAALAVAVAPRTRHRRIGIASLAVATATLVAMPALHSSENACAVVQVPDTVWAARRTALVRRLPSDVTPYVEHWLESWSAASGHACTTRDPALRARRDACLDRTLGKLDALLARWEAQPPREAIALYVALEGVPSPAWCSEPGVAETPEPPPAQRLAIAALEGELAAATTIPAHEALLARARVLGYAPLITEVELALAGMQSRTDRPTAIRTLRASIAGARGFSSVEATIALISLLDSDAIHEVEVLAAAARARLVALGGDPGLEAHLDFRLGNALSTAGRANEAIAAFERSRLTERMAHGAGSPQEANALVSLAGAYFARDGTIASPAGRAAGKAADEIWKHTRIPLPSVIPAEDATELLSQLARMRELAVEQYGPDSDSAFTAECNFMDAYVIADQPERALEHARLAFAIARRNSLRAPQLAHAHSQTAFILAELGRNREALPHAREAVAMARALGVETELATALTILGRATLESGQPRAARDALEDALAIRVRLNESGRFRGHTRFWLAVALWHTDHARALAQATVAREEIAQYLDMSRGDEALLPLSIAHQRRYLQALVERIDQWLRTHRS